MGRNCVLHPDREPVTFAAQIPVCLECWQAYRTEAIAGGNRPFYTQLQIAEMCGIWDRIVDGGSLTEAEEKALIDRQQSFHKRVRESE